MQNTAEWWQIAPETKTFDGLGQETGSANGKTPEKRMSDYAFREKKSERLSYWLNELLTYRVNYVRHSATRSIRIWIYHWYSARKRCLFSLFAGTVFQERHCVPVPLRMCRYGKQGLLSLQGCKPPYSNYRIPVCFALSRIPLKLRSCKEPLSLHGMSGRLLRTGRKVPIRSWRLRQCLSAWWCCRYCSLWWCFVSWLCLVMGLHFRTMRSACCRTSSGHCQVSAWLSSHRFESWQCSCVPEHGSRFQWASPC